MTSSSVFLPVIWQNQTDSSRWSWEQETTTLNMKLCRSRSLICVNYIQKCRFLMFSSRFRLLLQNKTFKPRSYTGGALIADFYYIEILTHCLLYYLLPSHAFLNMCFRYPDNWIRQLNQTMINAPTLWATLFLAFPPTYRVGPLTDFCLLFPFTCLLV